MDQVGGEFLLPITRQERVMLLTTLRALAEVAPTQWEPLRERVDMLASHTPGERRRRLALVEQAPDARLDWEWLAGLRQVLGPDRWSEADVLELVMHADRRELWQPRSATVEN